MKTIVAIVLMLAVAGCVVFENRVACAVAGDQAFYISKYGQIGVSSEIAEQDGKVICRK